MHGIATLKVGSLGTFHALDVARKYGAKYLVSSTSECYGDPLEHPQKETYWGNVNPIGPRSVYDEAKRFTEAVTMAYHRYHKVDTRIVRIFNTYGPRMQLNDGRVVSNFMKQALRGEDLTVYGDGSQTRSFCYVSDEIDGFLRLSKSDEHLPVNIGNPNEFTILECAQMVLKVTGSKSKIRYEPLPQDDPKQRRPDITKARQLLGWEPKIDLETGLRLSLDDILLVQEDLDARLELVVAPAFHVVDAQDRLDVAEKIALGQEFAHLAADEGRPAEAAADIDGKAELALFVAHDLEPDVVRLDDRAVMRSAIDGDLELARQEREFRMERRPLAQDLGVGPRIGDLVVRDAGEMVRGNVAHAIARGLDRVHFDGRKLGEDVGCVLQGRPVVLDVLPGGEMPVAAIVFARDLGELAHLARVQGAVGHGDAQHVGMELQIEPVHQAMRAKLLLGQFAGEPARDLIAELLDARGDEG